MSASSSRLFSTNTLKVALCQTSASDDKAANILIVAKAIDLASSADLVVN
jgi:hypothetical protein